MNSGQKSLLLISVGPKIANPPLRKSAGPTVRDGQPVQLSNAKRRASSEQQRSKVGFPIRKFPDQSLFAAPRNLSQRTTSFIASQRQGIHQIPLRHLIALIAKARSISGILLSKEPKGSHGRQTAGERSMARKDQFCFKRIRGSWRSAKGSTTGCSRDRMSAKRISGSKALTSPAPNASPHPASRPNALPLHDVRYRRT